MLFVCQNKPKTVPTLITGKSECWLFIKIGLFTPHGQMAPQILIEVCS